MFENEIEVGDIVLTPFGKKLVVKVYKDSGYKSNWLSHYISCLNRNGDLEDICFDDVIDVVTRYTGFQKCLEELK